jgi:hypothetical protein
VVATLKQSALQPASNLQRLKRPFAWPDLDSLRKTGEWIECHHLLQEALAL